MLPSFYSDRRSLVRPACVPYRTRRMCTTIQTPRRARPYDRSMISTLLIVLLILWMLGLATSYTLGGLIHVLLLIAIAVVLLRVINGQHPLRG